MGSVCKVLGLWAAALVFLFVSGIGVCRAGTYLGLEPGVSTKAEADKALGAPIKEIVRDTEYEYAPQPDTRRVSIKFAKKTQVIESIDIYSQEPHLKRQYVEWFQLGSPEKTGRDERGRLVEYYGEAGMALHFAGPDEGSAVESFSHLASAPQKAATSSVKTGQREERSYIDESKKAVSAKDWERAKNQIEEGLRFYPKSAGLWHSRAMYYFYTDAEPGEVRPKESTRSMERAYQLEPSGKHAAEVGWLYRELQKDCRKALPYFEEADRKGHGAQEPTLHYWMGRCYEEAGRLAEATIWYSRFIEASPNHEFARDAGKRISPQGGARPVLPAALDLSNATEAWAKEWTVTASATQIARDGRFGFYPTAERRGDADPNPGRKGLLYVHPPKPGIPATIERHVTLHQRPLLSLGVSANRTEGANWDLLVKVDGRTIGAKRTIDGRSGWQDLTYDLSPFANRAVTITVEVIPTGWHFEYAFFDYIEIR